MPHGDPTINAALVHYWLVNMRGGEKVLQKLASMYPEAPIHTHVVDRSALSADLRDREYRTTFIQRLPQARRRYQQYLPLMPLALEELDMREFDLVISSESGPAKGVVCSPTATHVCYCHSPMRYVWDMYHDYKAKASLPVRLAMGPIFHYLRMWDQSSAARVDRYAANSRYVAERIRRTWGRDSQVIAPPVQVDDFRPSEEKGDFHLFFGELVAYKRADLAVEAFRASGRKLIVAGKGEQLDALRRTAPHNVTFTGQLPFEEVRRLLAQARSLVFPGVEDFGIVPVEAMASGTPVVAYGAGGVLDSVQDGRTGIFFGEQTPTSLNAALDRLEAGVVGLTRDAMLERSRKFSPERFEREFRSLVERSREEKQARLQGDPNPT